jgi:hypothetical protein
MQIIARKNRLVPGEVEHLLYWIRERESIRLSREAGNPPPWSHDPIIANYRWCNVRRMDDKVSRWVLGWHRQHPEIGLQNRIVALLSGRLINWPDTLEELPYPAPYEEARWTKIILARKARGEKVFTGAYIINGALGGDKILQVTQKILKPIWALRRSMPQAPETMQSIFDWLNGKPGIGTFMAGQVVADMRHVHYEYPWADRMTWAPQGPGSLRGVNRLIGQHLDYRLPKGDWLDVVRRAMAAVARAEPAIAERLELMDIQNCLCEYDKFRRLTLGQGSVRARYVPK